MKRRGLLIPVLLLVVLMLVLCMAELGRQPFQYKAAVRVMQSSQARALSLSGLEDFRTKWIHDYSFPPAFPEGSNQFTYTEILLDWQTNAPLGAYRVTVQGEWRLPPYRLYKVSSEGLVGPADNPACLFVIEALLDIEPSRAGFGNWIEWRERAL